MGIQFIVWHELEQELRHCWFACYKTKMMMIYLNAVKQVQFDHKQQDVKGEHFCQEIMKDVL